jgi:hypothetical protein
LIFQEERNLNEACAKNDTELIKRNEEIGKLEEQVENLRDSVSM